MGEKGLVAYSSPVQASPCWNSSSAQTPAPSGMCHPPTAGRSLRSPRQSHPPLAPGLALRSAAASPVPAQWQEAGGKWQSLSHAFPLQLPSIHWLAQDTGCYPTSTSWCFAIPSNSSTSQCSFTGGPSLGADLSSYLLLLCSYHVIVISPCFPPSHS